jgi:hypothetical protein
MSLVVAGLAVAIRPDVRFPGEDCMKLRRDWRNLDPRPGIVNDGDGAGGRLRMTVAEKLQADFF